MFFSVYFIASQNNQEFEVQQPKIKNFNKHLPTKIRQNSTFSGHGFAPAQPHGTRQVAALGLAAVRPRPSRHGEDRQHPGRVGGPGAHRGRAAQGVSERTPFLGFSGTCFFFLWEKGGGKQTFTFFFLIE